MESKIIVSANLHPLIQSEVIESEAEVGMSLRQIVGEATDEKYISVYVNNQFIPSVNWDDFFPKEDQIVFIQTIVHGSGSGGKNILRIVAMIAVVAVAAYLTGPVGASEVTKLGFAVGSTASNIAGAGITTAGFLLVNALIPPQTPQIEGDADFQHTNDLTGSQNRIGLYAPIPKIYGEVRYFPPIPPTHPPYTTIIGNDQYLYLYLMLGYGPLQIGNKRVGGTDFVVFGPGVPNRDTTIADLGDAIKIGDTHITNIEGVHFYIGEQRWIPENHVLHPKVVDEKTLNLSFEFTKSQLESLEINYWYKDNVSEIRTSEGNVSELSVDFVFPAGLFSINSQGKARYAAVSVQIEYRRAGSGDFWRQVAKTYVQHENLPDVCKPDLHDENQLEMICIPNPNLEHSLALAQQDGNTIIADNHKGTVRWGHQWRVPTTGVFANHNAGYDVRITRVGTFSQGYNSVITDFQWTALRTFQKEEVWSVPNTVVMSLRAKASDILSGTMDALSIKATSILRKYRTATKAWEEVITSNPSWVIADILKSQANQHPLMDHEIDLAEFEDFETECINNGTYFNAVFDSHSTIRQRVKDVLAVARATEDINRDGKFTIVRDNVLTVPSQQITNINSSNFTAEKVFPEIPHAIRVQFKDSKDDRWENDEVIAYDTGYNSSNARNYEVLSTIGITNHIHAWKYGRWHLAQMRLRPEVYSVDMDIERLKCSKGALVELTHDVIMTGSGSGRITALNAQNEFVSSEEFVMDNIHNYAVRIRKSDGSVGLWNITNSGGYHTTITVSGILTGVNVGDQFAYGIVGKEKMDVKVQSILPKADFAAAIKLIPAAPEIWDADKGPIPDWSPNLTKKIDPTKIPPRTPHIEYVKSGDDFLTKKEDGTVIVNMMVGFGGVAGLTGSAVQVRYKRSTGFSWTTVNALPFEESVLISEIEEGVTYLIQIRLWSNNSTPNFSEWSAIVYHTVIGKTAPPPKPTAFDVTAVSGSGLRQAIFRINDAVKPLDFAGFKIKYLSGFHSTPDWDLMIDLHDDYKTPGESPFDFTRPVAAGNYTFACKSVDTSKIESREYILIQITLPVGPLEGILELLDFVKLGWPGVKTNCYVAEDGYLYPESVETWNTAGIWDSDLTWGGTPVRYFEYEHTPINLGATTEFTPSLEYQSDTSVTLWVKTSLDGITYDTYTEVDGPVKGRYFIFKLVADTA